MLSFSWGIIYNVLLQFINSFMFLFPFYPQKVDVSSLLYVLCQVHPYPKVDNIGSAPKEHTVWINEHATIKKQYKTAYN